MKHCLLLLGVVAALAIGAPAYSQYIYMDVDGINGCTTDDVLTETTTAVDVWLDTNHNAAGTQVFCGDGVNTFDIFGYDVIVEAGGAGSVTYTSWTNRVAAFVINRDTARNSGGIFSIGWYAPFGTVLPEGLYRLGTLNIAVSGNPTLSFRTTSTLGGAPFTGFGSDCSGTVTPNSITLGTDFLEGCGTSSGTPAEATTWGKIKNLYR